MKIDETLSLTLSTFLSFFSFFLSLHLRVFSFSSRRPCGTVYFKRLISMAFLSFSRVICALINSILNSIRFFQRFSFSFDNTTNIYTCISTCIYIVHLPFAFCLSRTDLFLFISPSPHRKLYVCIFTLLLRKCTECAR